MKMFYKLKYNMVLGKFHTIRIISRNFNLYRLLCNMNIMYLLIITVLIHNF